MVAVVGGTQAGEFFRVGQPVKISAVHNTAPHPGPVAVHIFGGGVGHNIAAPLEGPAVDGGGKGVVHNQGHAVAVCGLGKLLNIQHGEGRIGDGFAKHRLGVGLKRRVQLLLGTVGGDEGEVDAHLPHSDVEKVVGAAIDGGGGHHMVAAVGNIEDGVEVGRLAGGGEHGRSASLHVADLGGHHIVGGVLKPGIEISAGLQVEELAHVLAGGVLKGGGLDNGNLPRLSVAGGVAPLDAFGVDPVVTHVERLLSLKSLLSVMGNCGFVKRFVEESSTNGGPSFHSACPLYPASPNRESCSGIG